MKIIIGFLFSIMLFVVSSQSFDKLNRFLHLDLQCREKVSMPSNDMILMNVADTLQLTTPIASKAIEHVDSNKIVKIENGFEPTKKRVKRPKILASNKVVKQRHQKTGDNFLDSLYGSER